MRPAFFLPATVRLRPLAGARVGLGALAAHRKATAVPQPLVAADLDLAADVGSDLATQVTLELVARLEVVTQPDQVLVGQVRTRTSGLTPVACERLRGAGAPDAEDVGERDLDALVAREVDADQTCHVAVSPGLVRAEVWSSTVPTDPVGSSASAAGGGVPGRPGGRVLRCCASAWSRDRCVVLAGTAQPWRCLWRRFSQITMTRP